MRGKYFHIRMISLEVGQIVSLLPEILQGRQSRRRHICQIMSDHLEGGQYCFPFIRVDLKYHKGDNPVPEIYPFQNTADRSPLKFGNTDSLISDFKGQISCYLKYRSRVGIQVSPIPLFVNIYLCCAIIHQVGTTPETLTTEYKQGRYFFFFFDI